MFYVLQRTCLLAPSPLDNKSNRDLKNIIIKIKPSPPLWCPQGGPWPRARALAQDAGVRAPPLSGRSPSKPPEAILLNQGGPGPPASTGGPTEGLPENQGEPEAATAAAQARAGSPAGGRGEGPSAAQPPLESAAALQRTARAEEGRFPLEGVPSALALALRGRRSRAGDRHHGSLKPRPGPPLASADAGQAKRPSTRSPGRFAGDGGHGARLARIHNRGVRTLDRDTRMVLRAATNSRARSVAAAPRRRRRLGNLEPEDHLVGLHGELGTLVSDDSLKLS